MTSPQIRGSATTANSTSTSYSCNKPTGVVQDDLMLMLQFADVGIGTITSGWTQLQALTTADLRSRVGMKVAGGSEGANYALTQTSGSDGGAIILALSDILAGQTPVSDTSTAGSGATITTPSVTPLGGDDFEIRFVAALAVTSFTAPGGWTERADVASGSACAGTCATRVLSSSGATGTANFTANTTAIDRHGYTITVSGKPDASGRRLLVASSVAVHRGTW
ncbi:hypothetical protein [Streptosporangium sp. NPDC006930]|uniref:hypothetical protein n=1 Tax=Streptosporangium sp. NPDC006930 TaxID=3154783 RepID=UPI0034496251